MGEKRLLATHRRMERAIELRKGRKYEIAWRVKDFPAVILNAACENGSRLPQHADGILNVLEDELAIADEVRGEDHQALWRPGYGPRRAICALRLNSMVAMRHH